MSGEHRIHSVGDVVLIHYQEKPAVYARIEAIEPDPKKDWYQVTFLFLTIPSRTVTWILREEYINGAPFTMGGQPVRLGEVNRVFSKKEYEEEERSPEKKPQKGTTKVIPFKRQL